MPDKNGVVIKHSRAIASKYVCNKCQKTLLASYDEFNVVTGDVEIPTLLDHLTQLRLFQRVK